MPPEIETPAAGTTQDTSAATPAAQAPAAAAPAAAATPAASEQQAAADKPAAAQAADAKPVETAPAKYEIKAPNGLTLEPEVQAKFEGVARELGMTNAAAQKVIDAMIPELAQRQRAAVEAVRTGWVNAAKADKEFGGDKFDENLGLAARARDAIASPELRTFLDSTGLGDHPEIIRMFIKVGQKISSASFVAGAKDSGAAAGASLEDRAAAKLYPTKVAA